MCLDASRASAARGSPLQGGNPAKVAVQALSLAIERGEVFGLLGPNGAGKTSAINMMIGFLEPTSGTWGPPAAEPSKSEP